MGKINGKREEKKKFVQRMGIIIKEKKEKTKKEDRQKKVRHVARQIRS